MEDKHNKNYKKELIKTITITAHSRGHKITYIDNKWVYADNGMPIGTKERACTRCGKMPTPEGYDACLGYIEGVESACCGHGVESPILMKKANDHN